MRKGSSNSNSGQSLIEVLIGIAVGVIIIGGVAATIAVVLRSNVTTKNSQTAAALAQEVMNEAGDLATADWHKIDTLTFDLTATPPVSGQYRIATTSGFSILPGSETFTLDGKSFTRFFTVEYVSRDGSGNIEPEASYTLVNDDPTTKRIVATVQWLEGTSPASVSLNKFVTRSRNLIFLQTDWRSGKLQATFPTNGTVVNDKFSNSAGIDFSGNSFLKVSGKN